MSKNLARVNSNVSKIEAYGQKCYKFFYFFIIFSLSSFFSLFFSLLFHLSSLSPLFSLTDSLSLINCWSWSVITNLSPVAFCIVIADLSRHHHRHCRSESMWASTLRWDRSVCHDRGHWCWGEVRSWSWVAGASGFWLLVQVDSWLWVGNASSFVGLDCQC